MTLTKAQGAVTGAYRTLSDDELEIVVGGAAAIQAGAAASQPPSKAPPPIEPATVTR
jgi:hypothetical protein